MQYAELASYISAWEVIMGLARFIGSAWALPATLVGISYVALPAALRWFNYDGRHDGSFVFSLSPTAPAWLKKSFESKGSHTLGEVIVLEHRHTSTRGITLLKHEQEHVRQWRIYGSLFPFVKFLVSLIMMPLRNVHLVYDSPFEIDARRAAGQPIDVIGALQRIAKKMEKKQ